MTDAAMSGELRCVAPTGDRCGEGVLWHAPSGALYWTDVNRFLVHRLDWRSGTLRGWFFDRPVVALAETVDPDRLVVALGSHVILWRPETDARDTTGFALSGWPARRLNDGRAGPDGAFWVGSMGNNVGPAGEAGPVRPGEGQLFRLAANGAATVLDGIGIANTVCFRADGRTLIFGDTLANTLWQFPILAAPPFLGERAVFFAGYERGLPDGSAIDAEGAIWNCRYGGGAIVRVGSDGRISRVVETGFVNPTTCAFGDPDLRTLFVSSAANGARESDRLAGGLFALTVDVPGLPAYRARLA